MAIDVAPLWDYSQPALSEQRFRAALSQASADDALILHTQIARTWGIRKDFDKARQILASIKDQVAQGSPQAQVRYTLELGRTYASTTHAEALLTDENKAAARQLFLSAFERAKAAKLDGLAIDALHMMVTVDREPGQQLAWNEKALAYLEASTQPEAKAWEGSLRNNVGHAQHLAGNYEAALTQYRLSLAAHERAGKADNVRIAHWMIAHTLRAQGKLSEALAIQLRLEQEFAQSGAPDPYVFEELEHLYRAIGDSERAGQYAEKFRAASK